jgi:hypothetical protein
VSASQGGPILLRALASKGGTCTLKAARVTASAHHPVSFLSDLLQIGVSIASVYEVRNGVAPRPSNCYRTHPSTRLEHLPVTHLYGKEHHDKRRQPDTTGSEPENARAA